MDLLAKTAKSAEARALLDSREDIIKSRDQTRVDAWRLAIGRTIDNLFLTSKKNQP